jgi:hypothetical protein
VIDRRTLPRILRRSLLAAAAAGTLTGTAAADSRDYPPTYASRKAPWYDPYRWFTSDARDAESSTATSKPTEGKPEPILVITSSPNPVTTTPSGPAGSPAWKWYGYGTPVSGSGNYPAVPANWHASVGSTPGAIPEGSSNGAIADPTTIAPPAPSRTEKPLAVAAPPDARPVSPRSNAPFPGATKVEWKSSGASIQLPQSETGEPRATLRMPVRTEESPTPPPPPVAPTPPTPPKVVTPAEEPEGPDLPVDPAPGILPPHAKAGQRETFRARSPEQELPETVTTAVRRACGRDVKVMEINSLGQKQILIRLSAPLDAAKAARDRLGRERDLAGWHIEFERVTPLSR